MKELLCHLLFPRESNHHRAKFLHHQSIVFLIILLFLGQFFLNFVKFNFPTVLGLKIDISSQELLSHTNQKRQAQGLSPLILSEDLSKAAYLKAADMFKKDYWAHTSPDGVTPWYYFKTVRYNYEYAGENLARGFTTSESIVNAWMTSQSHRENMLSTNYEEVGFAIVQGKLSGEETTLVVEMFGGKNKQQLVAKKSGTQKISSAYNISQEQTPSFVSGASSLAFNAFIDSSMLFKNISFWIIALFIIVLLLDMLIVERKKIVRFVGHNLDHIAFFSMLLFVIILFGRGILL